MAQEDNAKRLEEAKKLSKDSPQKAETVYKTILSKSPGSNDRAVREFESALIGLGELYRDHARTQDLATLIQQTRDVLQSFARAKTAKLGKDVMMTDNGRGADGGLDSPTTPRPPASNPEYHPNPNQRDEIMYRLGHTATPELPAPEPRSPPREPAHGYAIILYVYEVPRTRECMREQPTNMAGLGY